MAKSVQKKLQFLNEPKNFSEQQQWIKSNNFVNIILAITYYRPTTIWHKKNPYVAISLLLLHMEGLWNYGNNVVFVWYHILGNASPGVTVNCEFIFVNFMEDSMF